jgi:hypothetical protein
MKWVLLAFVTLSLLASAQNAPSTAPASGEIDSNDPLLQPPPLPSGNPSLIGGTVLKVDGVRNAMHLRPFGGKSMKVYFDERTHIYRDGIETTQLGIRKNDRVYVDTLLDNGHVFARSIRVETQGRLADARGRLVRFDPRSGSLSLLDELSSQPVHFRVDGRTEILRGGQPVTAAELTPNSLIGVHFAPEAGNRGAARQITIYAAPGSSFVFAGKVTFLDMKSGIFALQNRTDNHNYEIHFDPKAPEYSTLSVGTDITVNAVFDGTRYTARNIDLARQASSE